MQAETLCAPAGINIPAGSGPISSNIVEGFAHVASVSRNFPEGSGGNIFTARVATRAGS